MNPRSGKKEFCFSDYKIQTVGRDRVRKVPIRYGGEVHAKTANRNTDNRRNKSDGRDNLSKEEEEEDGSNVA